MKKPTRTISGVTPVTLFTKPYKCSGNCLFCPKEEGSPKSYLSNEPGIQRAVALEYDPYIQTQHRIQTYIDNKHNTDKIEIIISGGTWHDYPTDYQLWFISRIYEALNDFPNKSNIRTANLVTYTYQNLYKLQDVNKKAKNRCIGMSIETRPDKIDLDSLINLRKFGVTKVQLGIQSLSDELLAKNNRGHMVSSTQDAFNLLRANGFKIQAHWMCNLYGGSLDKDLDDFKKLFENINIRPDELKIYPCALIQAAPLYQVYKKGGFKPYKHEQLVQLLKECKQSVPTYCRISRVFRDIPAEYIVEGTARSNIREDVQRELFAENKACQCIRCREIRRTSLIETDQPEVSVIEFETAVSNEYFIQFTQKGLIRTPQKMQDLNKEKLLGFLRLSIYKGSAGKSQMYPFDAMIRELHVYGKSLRISEKSGSAPQHSGFGIRLIQLAEKIVTEEGCKSLGVIASVGTREYYEKRGFAILPEIGYGIKNLN